MITKKQRGNTQGAMRGNAHKLRYVKKTEIKFQDPCNEWQRAQDEISQKWKINFKTHALRGNAHKLR